MSLTLATIARQQYAARPHGRARILAKHDPLRNVPRGDFTLASFSYRRARLCQREFFNCALTSFGVA